MVTLHTIVSSNVISTKSRCRGGNHAPWIKTTRRGLATVLAFFLCRGRSPRPSSKPEGRSVNQTRPKGVLIAGARKGCRLARQGNTIIKSDYEGDV